MAYVRSKVVELNSMLADVARQTGAGFVDLYRPSTGHDPCEPTGTRWVEPLVPSTAAAPLHPNAVGMAAKSAVIAAAVV